MHHWCYCFDNIYRFFNLISLSTKNLSKGNSLFCDSSFTSALVICVGVIFRTSKDVERVSTFYRETPKSVQVEEIPRMEKVMKSFNIIKKVEIAIFIIGLAMIIIFWRNELIRGIAVGLLIMSVSLYTFDHIAESRGEAYIQFLKSL